MQLADLQHSLATCTGLILPFGLAKEASLEEKLRTGLNETAERALEVIEIRAEVHLDGDDFRIGRKYGDSLINLLEVVNTTDLLRGGQVWQNGLRKTLEISRNREWIPCAPVLKGISESTGFLEGYREAIFQARTGHSPATLAVIRATIACRDAGSQTSAIPILLADLSEADS